MANELMRVWRHKFSLGLINTNELVKHADFSQTLVNLGHHLEDLANTNDNLNQVNTHPWSKLGQRSSQTLVKTPNALEPL
jgi:hypothetical protein